MQKVKTNAMKTYLILLLNFISLVYEYTSFKFNLKLVYSYTNDITIHMVSYLYLSAHEVMQYEYPLCS